MFYDEYSSDKFLLTVEKYLNNEFVQPRIGQIEKCYNLPTKESNLLIVQSKTAQLILKNPRKFFV